jgi:transcriptional regulator with XRE-family HTH domain
MSVAETIGERIKGERLRLELNQRQLAEAVEVGVFHTSQRSKRDGRIRATSSSGDWAMYSVSTLRSCYSWHAGYPSPW